MISSQPIVLSCITCQILVAKPYTGVIQLVTYPGLLFLDEPTSGLDSTASKLVIAALQEVRMHRIAASSDYTIY